MAPPVSAVANPVAMYETLALLALLALGLWPLLRQTRRTDRRPAVLAGALAALLVAEVAAWSARQQTTDQSRLALQEALPGRDQAGPFTSSAACRACHPGEYASWHASFHRQMTQPATPGAVRASFDGQQFDLGPATARLSRRGDEFWVELSGPSGRAAGAPRERRVVMTTGAHHMQGFWVSHGKGNLLDQLPLMWLVGEVGEPGRWIPIADSFLKPPGSQAGSPWNASCIFCHSVRGRPRLDRKTMAAETTAAELGIACEACHGPAREHVAANRDPRRRYRIHAAATDDTIVQPARLPPDRSAQVCGHCHSVAKFTNDQIDDDWYRSGSAFRPGDDLDATRLALLPARLPPDELAALRSTHGAFLTGNFWPDGMVRVAGREYNGLLESACYQQGGMTCLSCHSLHRSEPNDQLARGMDGNQACYQCHESYREKIPEHTHHGADSGGSLCYNCHMPHTTYGLFKGIRSHQISSPSAGATLSTGRPNACNLCHLDQTLGWAADHMEHWYGQPAVELDEDHCQIAAGVLWLLRGDAAQRALTAYAAGSESARAAPGDGWSLPFLAALLEDDYSAVRLVAARSLRRLGQAIDYDFIGPPEHRAAVRRKVVEQWRQRSAAKRRAADRRLLIGPDGDLDQAALDELLRQRDDSPVTIQE